MRRRAGRHREHGMSGHAFPQARCLGSGHADGRHVVVHHSHAGGIVRRHDVVGAANQREGHGARQLVGIVIGDFNAVVDCVAALGNGHLLSAACKHGIRREVTHQGHRQHDSERLNHPNIRRHPEHSMLSGGALGHTGDISEDADGRQVVVNQHHRGFIVRRAGLQIVGARTQGQGHGAVLFHIGVVDYGDAVGGRAFASFNGQLLSAQGGRRHKVIALAHPQHDIQTHCRHRVGRHREHGMSVHAFGQRRCVGSGDADGRHIIVTQGHQGLVVRRLGHGIAGTRFQPGCDRAFQLIQSVIHDGNAVAGSIGAGSDGHRLDPRSAGIHKLTRRSHGQPDGERLNQGAIRYQAEHGMAVVAFRQAGTLSGNADGRLVIIHEGHAGLVSLLVHFVVCVLDQGEGHGAAGLVCLVVDDGNTVGGSAFATIDDQLLVVQLGRRHKAARLPHKHKDGEGACRHRVSRHRELGMNIVAFGQRRCLGSGDTDGRQIIVHHIHAGFIAWRCGHRVASGGHQGEGDSAGHLVDVIRVDGNTVVDCVAPGGDGRLLGALVAHSHKVTRFTHHQHHIKVCRQRAIRHHPEHGMHGGVALVALGHLGSDHSQAERRQLLTGDGHLSAQRGAWLVASARLHHGDDCAWQLIVIVVIGGYREARCGAAPRYLHQQGGGRCTLKEVAASGIAHLHHHRQRAPSGGRWAGSNGEGRMSSLGHSCASRYGDLWVGSVVVRYAYRGAGGLARLVAGICGNRRRQGQGDAAIHLDSVIGYVNSPSHPVLVGGNGHRQSSGEAGNKAAFLRCRQGDSQRRVKGLRRRLYGEHRLHIRTFQQGGRANNAETDRRQVSVGDACRDCRWAAQGIVLAIPQAERGRDLARAFSSAVIKNGDSESKLSDGAIAREAPLAGTLIGAGNIVTLASLGDGRSEVQSRMRRNVGSHHIFHIGIRALHIVRLAEAQGHLRRVVVCNLDGAGSALGVAIASARLKGQGQGAIGLVGVVVIYGDAQVSRGAIGADGEPVRRCAHNVAALAHSQHDGDVLQRRRAGRHREHGMSVHAFGQA